jgi:hypothetical protein
MIKYASRRRPHDLLVQPFPRLLRAETLPRLFDPELIEQRSPLRVVLVVPDTLRDQIHLRPLNVGTIGKGALPKLTVP